VSGSFIGNLRDDAVATPACAIVAISVDGQQGLSLSLRPEMAGFNGFEQREKIHRCSSIIVESESEDVRGETIAVDARPPWKCRRLFDFKLLEDRLPSPFYTRKWLTNMLSGED